MSDDKENDKQLAVEMLTREFDKKGVAVTSVTDGHVMMFTRTFLQKLLDSLPGQEKIVIHIKRPGAN